MGDYHVFIGRINALRVCFEINVSKLLGTFSLDEYGIRAGRLGVRCLFSKRHWAFSKHFA